jgi:hypothetical protein
VSSLFFVVDPSTRHNRGMEEVLLMTGIFVAGAGAGAMISYARDRNLLRLYGHMVHDLSAMIPHAGSEGPEPPAAAAPIPKSPSITDAVQKRAS